MQIPFLAWLLQGIPESIAVAVFVFSLSTKAFSWNNVLKVGIIQAIVIYLVRLMPFTPGVHTLVLITSLALVSMMIGKLEFKKAVAYSAIIISFIVVFEFAFYSLITLCGVMSFQEMNNNVWTRIAVSYPQVIVVCLLSLLVRRKGLNRGFDKIFQNQKM